MQRQQQQQQQQPLQAAQQAQQQAEQQQRAKAGRARRRELLLGSLSPLPLLALAELSAPNDATTLVNSLLGAYGLPQLAKPKGGCSVVSFFAGARCRAWQGRWAHSWC